MIVLERDGYVKKHAPVQTKGRPGLTFVLNNKGVHVLPKHYRLFAELLIKMIKHKLGSEEMIGYMDEMGA